jgi:hypothetical protein
MKGIEPWARSQYESFIEYLKAGEVEPTVIPVDNNGIIHDGHHRTHAFMEAGLVPEFRINPSYEQNKEEEILDLARVARVNISNRRDVSNLSRVKAAIHIFLPEQKMLAERRQKQMAASGKKIDENEKGEATELAAKIAGLRSDTLVKHYLDILKWKSDFETRHKLEDYNLQIEQMERGIPITTIYNRMYAVIHNTKAKLSCGICGEPHDPKVWIPGCKEHSDKSVRDMIHISPLSSKRRNIGKDEEDNLWGRIDQYPSVSADYEEESVTKHATNEILCEEHNLSFGSEGEAFEHFRSVHGK